MATKARKQHLQHYQEARDLIMRELGTRYHLSKKELVTLLKEVLELLQEGDAEQ